MRKEREKENIGEKRKEKVYAAAQRIPNNTALDNFTIISNLSPRSVSCILSPSAGSVQARRQRGGQEGTRTFGICLSVPLSRQALQLFIPATWFGDKVEVCVACRADMMLVPVDLRGLCRFSVYSFVEKFTYFSLIFITLTHYHYSVMIPSVYVYISIYLPVCLS